MGAYTFYVATRNCRLVVNKKIITYTLLFSFLLTAAGCYTTKNYADSPEELIAKENGQKNVIYEDLDSLTLINNKTIDLDLYTSRFIKGRTDSSYKFVYFYPRVVFDTAKMLSLKSNKAFYKDAVPDTLDIRNISTIHYSISTLDNSKTILTIGLSIAIAAVAYVVIALIAFHAAFSGTKH